MSRVTGFARAPKSKLLPVVSSQQTRELSGFSMSLAAADNQQPRSHELSIFHDVAKALTSSLDLDTVLETIMAKVAAYFKSADWSLLMVDESSKELYYAVAVGEGCETVNSLTLTSGETLAHWILETGEALVIPDITQDPRIRQAADRKSLKAGSSVVCMPVRTGGKILGIIQVMNIDMETYSRNQLLLQTLADYAAIAIENARAVRRIQELSITDDCTGLYNARHLFTVLSEEVHRSERFGYNLALLFLDLDHFKRVNDEHGHLVGSALLAQVGQFLRENLRLVDAAFRYGGDEFAILLPQTSREGGLLVARRFMRLFHTKQWTPAENITLPLTASIGIAAYPSDAATPKDIVQRGDEMMYLVKQSGRDNIAIMGKGVVGIQEENQ
jgi:diguanylate cyclase (GGDEF)-like protein